MSKASSKSKVKNSIDPRQWGPDLDDRVAALAASLIPRPTGPRSFPTDVEQGIYTALRSDLFDRLPNETPMRWVKAMREMTRGYEVDVAKLFKVFDVGFDGMVTVGPVKFYSLCEHHLLPFYGAAWVAYLPNARTGRVVGLSKLARVVAAFAKRFQVQERLTQQIAEAVLTHLDAAGVGVRIESTHTCMAARGIEKEGVMRTQVLLGNFKQVEVRNEFIALCGRSQ